MPGRLVTAPPERWEKLAEYVKALREGSDLTQLAAASRSDKISLAAWSVLEGARQPNGRMEAKSLEGASIALGQDRYHLEEWLTGVPVLDASSAEAIKETGRRIKQSGGGSQLIDADRILEDLDAAEDRTNRIVALVSVLLGKDEPTADDLRSLSETLRTVAAEVEGEQQDRPDDGA